MLLLHQFALILLVLACGMMLIVAHATAAKPKPRVLPRRRAPPAATAYGTHSTKETLHLEPLHSLELHHGFNIMAADRSRKVPGRHIQPFADEIRIEFDAFGQHFDLGTLKPMTGHVNPDAMLDMVGDNGVTVSKHIPLLSYSTTGAGHQGDRVHATITLHEKKTPLNGYFRGSVVVDGELFHITPAHEHREVMSEDGFALLSAAAPHGLVVYRDSDVPREGEENEQLCGAMESKYHNPFSNEQASTVVTLESHAPFASSIGRNLKTLPSAWNCKDSTTRRITWGVAVDLGYWKRHGSNENDLVTVISDIWSQLNSLIYVPQLQMFVEVNQILAKTTTDTSSGTGWNSDPASNTCGASINDQLDLFSVWRGTYVPNTWGDWHLMTNCWPPPGTVGLAWIGVLCLAKLTSNGAVHSSGTGVSTHSSTTWTTVAHELGHNFNAQHSFESGQGTTGGIMDYGDGKLNGIYQFNTPLRKTEVCQEIVQAIDETWPNYSNVFHVTPHSSCIKNSYTPGAAICGNGIVEAGEVCDPIFPDSCCVNCQLGNGCVCPNSDPCCNNGQIASAGTVCRSAAHPTCDQVVETCTGSSSKCPTDTWGVTLGTRCTDANGYQSHCWEGQCLKSLTQQCKDEVNPTAYSGCWWANGDQACYRTMCTMTQGSGSCSYITAPVLDGTQCDGTSSSSTLISKFCEGGVCKLASAFPQPTPQASYSWSTGSWGSCNAPCGSGTQTRSVTCRDQSNAVVSDSNCNAGTKPATSQSCNTQACATWNSGSWSSCSSPCGGGTQTRTVVCKIGSSTVSDSTCVNDGAGTKPATSQSCNTAACTYSWAYGSWSSCSAVCGGGTRTRTKTCKRDIDGTTVSNTNCGASLATSEACNTAACATWDSSDPWGSCSQPCDGGTQTRSVLCKRSGSTVVDQECIDDGAGTKPTSSQACNTASCTWTWVYGSWGTCSTSCGSGTQTRTGTCTRSQDGAIDSGGSSCSGSAVTSQSCNTQACPTFNWVFTSWGSCSATCGGGTQTRTVQCEESASPGVAVSDSSCSGTKPAASQSCQTQACALWATTAFGACSAACDGGTQTRTVTCRLGGTGSVVPDSTCTTDGAGTKPSTSQACNSPACTYDWLSSSYGSCSASCGQGVQTRSVVCRRQEDSVTVSDSLCSGAGTKPTTSQACLERICATWNVTDWSTCSQLCGSGTQTRTVSCKQGTTTVVESQCTTDGAGTKPASSRACNTENCATYVWSTGAYGACDVSCGTGTKTRTVQCIVDGTSTVVADSQCLVTNPKPATSTSCDTGVSCKQITVTGPAASAEWEINTGYTITWTSSGGVSANVAIDLGLSNSWTAITASTANDGSFAWTPSTSLSPSSGYTIRVRDLSDGFNAVSGSFSLLGEADWVSGPWSGCSQTCDGGTQTRTVTCKRGATVVSDSTCSGKGAKPATSQSCNAQACTYIWETGFWSSCSVSCGGGTQTRSVTCKQVESGNVASNSLCDANSKPDVSRACSTTACAIWTTTSWSSCSDTCGGGTRTRSVSCTRSGTVVQDSFCAADGAGAKPATSEACNTAACTYSWFSTAWGSCSASCGSGTQTRSVVCRIDSTSITAADVQCSGTKPSSSQACNTQACPQYVWTTSAWSSCSLPCGGGSWTRTVQCEESSSPGVVVSDGLCDGNSKPPASDVCNATPCPSWNAGAFSGCSVSCGGGNKTRSVQCLVGVDVVGDNVCLASSSAGNKPDSVVACNPDPCPTYTWKAGVWSQCSVTCGVGTQVRSVSCEEDGTGLQSPESLCVASGYTKPSTSQSCTPGVCRQINVTAPVSGDVLLIDSNNPRTYAVRWSYAGDIASVNVFIVLGAAQGILHDGLSPQPAITKKFDWTVGSRIPTLNPGSSYAIRVEDAADSSMFGISDLFSIQRPLNATGGGNNGGSVSFSFSKPTNAQIAYKGATFKIEWTYTGSASKVRLEYIKGAGSAIQIVEVDNLGSYNWNVPNSGLSDGSDYTLKITDVSPGISGTPVSASSSAFSIQTPDACTSIPCGQHGNCTVSGQSFVCSCFDAYAGPQCEIVPSLDVGFVSTLIAGRVANILWSSEGNIDKVTLILHHQSWTAGIGDKKFAINIPNSGSYQWIVPATERPDTGYQIRVRYVSPKGVQDDFESTSLPFEILPPCTGVDCGNHGNCTQGVCECRDDFSGDACTVPPESKCLGRNCNGHGQCNSLTGVCTCGVGWSGPDCQYPDGCSLRCSNQGQFYPNCTCGCDALPFWSGTNCSTCDIQEQNLCNFNGTVTSDCTRCQCFPGRTSVVGAVQRRTFCSLRYIIVAMRLLISSTAVQGAQNRANFQVLVTSDIASALQVPQSRIFADLSANNNTFTGATSTGVAAASWSGHPPNDVQRAQMARRLLNLKQLSADEESREYERTMGGFNSQSATGGNSGQQDSIFVDVWLIESENPNDPSIHELFVLLSGLIANTNSNLYNGDVTRNSDPAFTPVLQPIPDNNNNNDDDGGLIPADVNKLISQAADLPLPLIIGGSAGGLGFIILVILGICWVRRRKNEFFERRAAIANDGAKREAKLQSVFSGVELQQAQFTENPVVLAGIDVDLGTGVSDHGEFY